MMMLARFFLLVAGVSLAEGSISVCSDSELSENPVLCHFLTRARDDEQGLADELYDSARMQGWVVDLPLPSAPIATERKLTAMTGNQLPVVLAHGMGDSCFSSGMQHITQKVSDLLGGVYAVCVPVGSTHSEDTQNGYFLNMDASVDVFAENIRKDEKLAGGFHAIGFSQGNNVIRGYITKVNEPTVNTFISVNGVNAGIGAVPYCRPDLTQSELGLPSMCDLLMEEASRSAYTEFAQEHSFQANYWRDPRPSARASYQKYSQLAVWNNEAGFVNETHRDNWAKTQRFVWVLATEDGMVWPREGEQWGAPDSSADDPFISPILPMNETEWYQKDLFGLRTAQEAGKNYFESFKGDHLAFSEADFEYWVNTYFVN